MMGKEVDVLIVGAGPAGLSAGITAASQGLRVLVCERKRLPVDKACGEGLMPSCLDHLEQLGVMKHLQAMEYFPFKGIRYHSPSGRQAIGIFREGPGWGVRRPVLSTAFLQRANELETLEIRDGLQGENQVRLLGRDTGRILVGIGKERIFARLLVGADGLNSQVRRWAGLDGPPATFQRWGTRQHFAIAPWSDTVDVHLSNGLEAYITPCGSNLVGVAFLWDRERWPVVQGRSLYFPSFLRAFPAVNQRLHGAQPVDPPRAIGPLEHTSRAPFTDGVVLIGDAAGYLDAITGEGVSLATGQALAFGTTVIPFMKMFENRPVSLGTTALSGYGRAYQEIVHPYFRITRFVLYLSRRPFLADGAVRFLAAWGGLFQHLLSANMGLVPLWPVRFR